MSSVERSETMNQTMMPISTETEHTHGGAGVAVEVNDELECVGCGKKVSDEDDHGNNADVADTCCKSCWQKEVDPAHEEALCDYCEDYDEIPRVAVVRRCIGGYDDENGVAHNAYDNVCEVCARREEEEHECDEDDCEKCRRGIHCDCADNGCPHCSRR